MSFRAFACLAIVASCFAIAACDGPQVVGGCCGGFDRINAPMSR